MEEEVPPPPFRKSALPFTCKSISLSLSLSPSGRGRSGNGNFSLPEKRENCISPRILDVLHTSFECGASFPLLEVRRDISCAKSFAGFLLFCARGKQFFKNWSVQRDLNIIEFLFLYRHLFFFWTVAIVCVKPPFFLGFDFCNMCQAKMSMSARERARQKKMHCSSIFCGLYSLSLLTKKESENSTQKTFFCVTFFPGKL